MRHDVGETENPVNSGVSEPTEGEQEEGTEGEKTPVIDEENNSEEDQEQIPDVEENLAGDSVEDPVEDSLEDPAEEEVADNDAVVFEAEENAPEDTTAEKSISLSGTSDDATLTIGGKTVGEKYPIEDTSKDIEVTVSARNQMFEVMYNIDGGIWTSALKKGKKENDSFENKSVSYGNGTYIIPKDKLTGKVQIEVLYLNEITIDWKGEACWRYVALSAAAARVQSDSESSEHCIWGPKSQYAAVRNEKTNTLFVAQNTNVTLKVGTYIEAEEMFDISSVTYNKEGESSSALQSHEGDLDEEYGAYYTYTLSISNTGKNDYRVAIDGVCTEKVRELAGFKVKVNNDSNELVGKNNVYAVAPWKKYVLEGYDQYGEAFAFDDYDEFSVKAGTIEGTRVMTVPLYGDDETLNYQVKGNCITIAAGKAVAGKKIEVQLVNSDNRAGKVTLDVAPAVTAVALKTGEAAVEQDFGTSRSYVLDGTNVKSSDNLRVDAVVKKVNGNAVSEQEEVASYVQAHVTGNNLNVITEPLGEDTAVTSVEAELHIVNSDMETALGKGNESVRVGSVTLTIKAADDEKDKTKYAEKLTVKATKAASCLYTRQEALVANVIFPAGTYNRGRDVEVYDIPEGLTLVDAKGRRLTPDAEGVVTLSEEKKTLDDDGSIILAASSNATLGKNTIKVRTTYLSGKDANVVQATGSVNVTVARGIENITLSSAPEIYKVSNKAATTKITVNYNTGNRYADAKSAAPKTKKVAYEIGRIENNEFVQDDYPLGSYYNKEKRVSYVAVKNGTVTVDKEYLVDKTPANNEFAVRVKAADYSENATAAVAEFRVVSDGADMGNVVLVDGDNKPAEVKTTYTVDELKKLKAIVVKAGAKPDQTSGAYGETDIVGSKYYTMTPVKGNVVVGQDGKFTVNKLANNVKIVATANDGSKNKTPELKFNVTYDGRTTIDGSGDKTVKVNYTVNYDSKIKTETVVPVATGETKKEIKLDYPTGTMIHLSVTDAENKKLKEHTSIYDLKLAVKNAKVVKKSADNLDLDIIMTKSPVTVTLSDAKGKNPKTFDIKNKFLDETTTEGKAYIKNLKAITPNVSFSKGVKLYADVSGQKLSFTMKQAVADARYVVVSAQNEEDDTKILMDRLQEKKIKINPAVKEFTLTCNNLKMPTLKKGASIAFTFLNRDGEIITQTTKALTLKTTALKKSYKLDAKYTLSETDAASVPLTGKGSAVTGVEFTKLYNANIKGTPNRFKEAFYVDFAHGTLGLKTKTVDGKIIAVARDEWLVSKDTERLHKDDWIGFVEYKVTYEDGTKAEFVSKIQVVLAKTDRDGNIATAKKYAASAVNVLNSNNMQGVTYVTIGKLPAGIKAAYAVPDNSKNKVSDAFEVLKVKGVSGAEDVAKIEGNAVTLKVKPTADGRAGSYKGDLYIIPEDSAYSAQTKWTDDEIKEKGVKLAITVNVKADNAKGKIKVTAKSVSFLGQEPVKLALNGKFKEYYYAEIPYTASIAAEIESVELANINKTGKNNKNLDPEGDKQNHLIFADAVDKAGFVAEKANNKDALGLYIDAEAFQKELVMKDAKEWSGSVFSKISVTVHFVGEDSTTAANGKVTYTKAVPESFNISITMPNPLDVTKAEELLGIALGIIRDTVSDDVKVNGIRDVRYSESDKVLTVIADDPDVEIATAMVEGTDDAIADALLANSELKGYVDLLTSIKVEVSENENTSAATEVKKAETEDANKQLLKDLLARYTDKLVKKLQDEGNDTPVWGNLEGRELKLTITAKKGDVAESQSCTICFVVNTKPEEDEGDELDIAIKSAVRRLNSAAAIPGVSGISYDMVEKKITITVGDDEQDIVASKNAGRDSTVQILLGELGKYMNSVNEVEFSHEEDYIIESVTVKKEDHEITETWISNLVDKWTDKLVKELGSRGNGKTTYGRLKGKELTVTLSPNTENEKSYTIVYQ